MDDFITRHSQSLYSILVNIQYKSVWSMETIDQSHVSRWVPGRSLALFIHFYFGMPSF